MDGRASIGVVLEGWLMDYHKERLQKLEAITECWICGSSDLYPLTSSTGNGRYDEMISGDHGNHRWCVSCVHKHSKGYSHRYSGFSRPPAHDGNATWPERDILNSKYGAKIILPDGREVVAVLLSISNANIRVGIIAQGRLFKDFKNHALQFHYITIEHKLFTVEGFFNLFKEFDRYSPCYQSGRYSAEMDFIVNSKNTQDDLVWLLSRPEGKTG